MEINQELLKRFKSGLWIVLAGSIAQILTMLAENIGMFKLSPTEQALIVIVLTSVTSQITRYLNK